MDGKFITVNHAKLYATVREMAKIAKHNNIPILDTIRFETVNGALKLSATDLSLREDRTLTATCKTNLDPVHFDARVLAKLLKPGKGVKAKNESVSIGWGGGKAIFKIEGIETKIGRAPVEPNDFPAAPTSKAVPLVLDFEKEFFASLRYVAPAMSTDETRLNLNSLYMDKDALTATDGHRLHQSPFESGLEKDESVLFPDYLISALLRVKPERSALIIQGRHDLRYITFATSDGWRISAKECPGTFPDYNRVFPSEKKAEVTANFKIADLLKAIDRVARVSTANNNASKFSFGYMLTVSVTDVDSNSEVAVDVPAMTIDYKMKRDKFAIGFNFAYVIGALQNVKSERVTVSLEDELGPTLWTFADGNRAVVMPMRV